MTEHFNGAIILDSLSELVLITKLLKGRGRRDRETGRSDAVSGIKVAWSLEPMKAGNLSKSESPEIDSPLEPAEGM